MKKISYFSLVVLLVFTSCQIFSFIGETATGSFSLEVMMDNSTPEAVSMIYENSKGESKSALLDLKSYRNGEYFTDDINVSTGNYKLKQFLVLDAHDSILAATPVIGSNKAGLVISTLPLDFSIEKNGTNKIEPEIVNYSDSDTPELFGYSSSLANVIGLYDNFGNSINNFTFNMLREITQDDSENIFISPVSMVYAFGLLYPGSRGCTTEEIRDVFHLNDFTDNEELYQLYFDFGNYLKDLDKGVDLSLAHAFWYKSGYHPLSSYLSVLNTYFDAEISDLDFNDASHATKVINDWASDNTNDKIKEVVKEENFSSDTRAVLANATYFKGNWINGFDKRNTYDEVFYTKTDGSNSITCKMMHGGTEEDPWEMDYYSNEHIQLVRIPFKDNSRYEMACIMPKEKTCDELLSELEGEQWDTWMEASSPRELILNMPKFEESFRYILKNHLINLGMTTMFSAPNLSGMFSDINDLVVDDVIQSTFISVDETGAEAAAVTVITVGVTSVGPSVFTLTLDHPFIYAIQDAETHAIIFIGTMKNPASSE